ncbi:MAG TPA: endo alpha-1,4 polygalactosaminidase [Solirubrobacteraceae bacterium]|nr:endo alpha-1,4 polygalactosaminidase [Solirubrobacteraceae bacterium]
MSDRFSALQRTEADRTAGSTPPSAEFVRGLARSVRATHAVRALLAAVAGTALAAVFVLPTATATPVALARSPAGGGSRQRWHPPAQLRWYWQLQGRLRAPAWAQALDLDGFDTTATEVARLHRAGRRVICYIDVGTWESWRADAKRFPRSLLGRPNGWPGERWLDIRALGELAPIMAARLRMCARKGFDAVEADNIDGYANDTGFPLTATEQLRYDLWIAREAHRVGLAIFQKNDLGQVRALEPHFDGALDEQCNFFSECALLAPYVKAHKPVLDAEYDRALYPGFCAADARAGIMGALFDVALDGRFYRPCWAPPR